MNKNKTKNKNKYLNVGIVLLAAMLTCLGGAGANAQSPSISSEFENKLVPDALGEGQLLFPSDLTVINGMIAISDSGTSRLNIFDMEGNFIARFGTQGDTHAGEIEMPMGITTDGEKLYLAANPEVATVWEVNDNGTSADALIAVPADETEIGPQHVAVDSDGDIYIVCGPTHHNMALPYRITNYDAAGILQAEADASTFVTPGGLDVSGTSLFVAETNPMGEKKILVYNTTDMTPSGVELDLPADSTPGDVDVVGTDLYVSVSSFTGGLNGVIRYDVSSLSPEPAYTQVVDTRALLGMGMKVTGIDVDADGNIYMAATHMMWSSSGQVFVYNATGTQTLSFPDQIRVFCVWGIDHDSSGKVYMLPMSFDGSPASIWTVNINGTELQELVNLGNIGGAYLKLDDAGHIWYNQLGLDMSIFELISSGVYALDMNGSELYNLMTYETSLIQDPATGEAITDGTRSFQIPTGILTSTEDGKHYLYVGDSKTAGWFMGGSGLVTKFEYEFEPEWSFTEVWTAGTFIASEPTRDLAADPPAPNEFSMPIGMALHPDGDVLYIVDGCYWRVAMLNPENGSWIGEFEAPALPEGYTRYSEALAHVMTHDENYEEALLFPLDVAVDPDSGLVYVSYHGGSGANVYTKTGEFIGHVGVADIDEGGIVAALNLDIVPTEDDSVKHVLIGDAHGWSVAVYEVTTSESAVNSTTELTAEVIPAISITVPTANADFGKVGAGMTSENDVITIVNTGSKSAKVSAMMLDDGDGFYNESLRLNSQNLADFSAVVPADISDFRYEYEVVANLEAPDWAGGKYDGTIFFVAESE